MAPAGAEVLGEVQSAPVARLVEQTLSQSDNMLAEALARHVALARDLPATFEGAAQAITDAVAEAGVDVTGVTLSDGSGLSREDKIPAEVLTAVVSGAADGSLGDASLMLSGLPVAGYDGTLADRGDDDPATAPGAIRAKTGTLLGVHALSGHRRHHRRAAARLRGRGRRLLRRGRRGERAGRLRLDAGGLRLPLRPRRAGRRPSPRTVRR